MRTTISSRCHPVARSWAAPSKPAGEPGPELQNPPPHRFIGNLQASLGQKLLHVAVAQGEPEIKPDRVLDDRRREPMSAIGSRSMPKPTIGHRLRPRFCDIAPGS